MSDREKDEVIKGHAENHVFGVRCPDCRNFLKVVGCMAIGDVDAYAMGKVREALEMAADCAAGYHSDDGLKTSKRIVESIRALSAKLSSGEVKSNG